MDAELTVLAASGATTLVGLMVSDAWTHMKERVVRVLTRDGEDRSTGEDLDIAHAELLAAREAEDEASISEIEIEWRVRLRRLLRTHPSAADELRALLAVLERENPAHTVQNVITGGVQHGPVVQGRDFSGLSFHTVAPALKPFTTDSTD